MDGPMLESKAMYHENIVIPRREVTRNLGAGQQIPRCARNDKIFMNL